MFSFMDPVTPAIRKIYEVFESEGERLSFPDLDARVVSQGVSQVEAAASAVIEAEAALVAARAALEHAQGNLLKTSQRALAYLRLYAEGQPELLKVVEQIALPRSKCSARSPHASPGDGEQNAARRRPRGRPRKLAPAEHLNEAEAGAA